MDWRGWLAICAALAVGLTIGLLSTGTNVASVPGRSLPVPTLVSSTSSGISATSTAPKLAAPKKTVAPTVPPASGAATPVAAPAASPVPTQGELESAALGLRGALINILCTASGGPLKSISGSGIIVDPRGIILTNAHVGQYFLLAGDPNEHVSCAIRIGGPARSAYTAKLMFISPMWIRGNPDTLAQAKPKGTGEHDFAFLAITGSLPAQAGATTDPLPNSFSFIPLALDVPTLYEPVVIGSYAAQFLTTSDIQFSLYPTLVFGSVQALYTFTTTSIDVISLGGTAAAQEGSSGGGVADAAGKLIATITTSTVEGDTSSRNLSAISENYIERDFTEETGTTLATLFAESPAQAASAFAPQIPALEAVITKNLGN